MKRGEETMDLGEGHTLTFAEFEGEVSGCSIAHKRPDGTDCDGWIAFAGRAWAKAFGSGQIATWSVLCRACGDHGFVREGRWVKA